ncbi:MAG: hypothetical protein RMK74_12430 [Myxococcales bacterium]|nr:hypothetical protein [Myxococcales bacterium]
MTAAAGSTTLAVLASLAVLSPGCASETRSLCWNVTGLVPGTSSYRLRILRGGCGEERAAIYDVTAAAGSVSGAMRPPRLPPGSYGFEVSAHGGDCGLLARGCTEARLPTAGGTCVQVLLQEVDEPQGCGPGARCERGLCLLLDAGIDGAMPDGGAHDAEADAGTVDAATTMDGGHDGGPSGEAGADARPPRTMVLHTSTGYGHSCASLSDGSLWCWEDNFSGKLGLGDTISRARPTHIFYSDWRLVDLGDHHTCALRTDGSLWCWGENGTGQLGLGDTTSRASPTRLGTDADWRLVSAGGHHTCAVRTDGSLWCWGYNATGQLGLRDAESRTSPVRVGTNSDWAMVAAGWGHTCAVRTDGSLWCWGLNERGQGGHGDTVGRAVPTRVGTESNWQLVTAGYLHSCGLRADGSLWCWGYNGYSELGLGDMTDRTTPEQVMFP